MADTLIPAENNIQQSVPQPKDIPNHGNEESLMQVNSKPPESGACFDINQKSGSLQESTLNYSGVEFVAVVSSNINAIAWHDGDLLIRFHHGGEYRYKDVPLPLFEQMKSSASVGKFFHSQIKDKFPFTHN